MASKPLNHTQLESLYDSYAGAEKAHANFLTAIEAKLTTPQLRRDFRKTLEGAEKLYRQRGCEASQCKGYADSIGSFLKKESISIPSYGEFLTASIKLDTARCTLLKDDALTPGHYRQIEAQFAKLYDNGVTDLDFAKVDSSNALKKYTQSKMPAKGLAAFWENLGTAKLPSFGKGGAKTAKTASDIANHSHGSSVVLGTVAALGFGAAIGSLIFGESEDRPRTTVMQPQRMGYAIDPATVPVVQNSRPNF